MDIFVLDDYTGPIQTHTLEYIYFRYDLYHTYNWTIPIGIKDNQVINITNKQLSFFPFKNKSIDPTYKKEAEKVTHAIQTTLQKDIVVIPDPVFLFFDFESSTSTVHTLDYLCYILYFYFKENHKGIKLLLPTVGSSPCKKFLKLLENYLPISYLHIEPQKTYLFPRFSCVRSYIHLLLPEVKQFISSSIIQPILQKYSHEPFYKNVIRVKRASTEYLQHASSVFPPSEMFSTFCKENNIYEIPEDMEEDLKIYYINKANTIYVSWGSIYYIYVNYYLLSTEHKYISVFFHKDMMAERRFLYCKQLNPFHEGLGEYVQHVGSECGLSIDQLYNTLSFQGEVLNDIQTLEEFVKKTRLKEYFDPNN